MSEGLAHEVVSLTRALRALGVTVGLGQAEGFARALTLVNSLDRRQVYLAGCATLVFRREDQPLFDEAFDAWWAPPQGAKAQKTPQAPRHDPKAFQSTALKSWMAERARESDPEVDVPEEVRAASAAELLGRREFSALTEAERLALAEAMADLHIELALRRTRRRVPARHGREVDLKRALRSMARLGVVPSLPRRARRFKPRPLVVLADVSGSMELYSRLVLQFLHGVTRRLGRTETFAFGTRLTCITQALKLTQVDLALREATSAIVDFGGGTRIGESLARFNRDHAGRVLRRGAVVLIVSDGWEVGDTGRLRAELEAIKRRCHRLVWLNPMMGSPRFQPTASGVAVATAVADDCLPISNLNSLQGLARHLSALPARPRRLTPH